MALIFLDESESNNSTDFSEECSNPEIYENHYAIPLEATSLNTISELESAIEEIKVNVLTTEAASDQRQRLVKKLIEFRMKLHDLKEITDDLEPISSNEEMRIVQHHTFILQKQYLHTSPQYCNKCDGVIWTVLQNYYRCKGCDYQVHSKCLNDVIRNCQYHKVSTDVQYICKICPEKGLAFQKFKCQECHSNFTLKNSWMEPRRCDYDGLYYCPMCHKNSTSVIPARVIKNWDFKEKQVCEASKQFLQLMSKKPNMNLEQLNPSLFGFVEALGATKRLREDIIIMKEYFMSCRKASSLKLLRLLEEKQHFVENSYMYSLADLIDVVNGSLYEFLSSVHVQFSKHIKEECEICRGRGFICEICENVQVIFPFDSGIHQCKQCNAVFHTICFSKRDSCPKCLRKDKIQKESQLTNRR